MWSSAGEARVPSRMVVKDVARRVALHKVRGPDENANS